MTCTGMSYFLVFDASPIQKGQGLDDAGFAKPQVMWQLWGVDNYTHLWGRNGRACSRRINSHEAAACASLPGESSQLPEGGHEEACAKSTMEGSVSRVQ
jgi:hypothetical protein